MFPLHPHNREFFFNHKWVLNFLLISALRFYLESLSLSQVYTNIYLHIVYKNLTYQLCYCLENPRDRGTWWAAVHGVAQSPTRLKRLSSSSSSSRPKTAGPLAVSDQWNKGSLVGARPSHFFTGVLAQRWFPVITPEYLFTSNVVLVTRMYLNFILSFYKMTVFCQSLLNCFSLKVSAICDLKVVVQICID